ncbi:SdrD B-like domain-containing protein [Allokutzneria albata]|uniref:Carboxypeptidase regulatory-like domain-containing protein n=1 Tax=Allokutzneria albata TaxID=211114 RepID=A0A1G9ZHJ1_ALLAB|nr:SdrD B-like domain-containing protein [Allokutzneria albata]SDN20789.1 Carboxypeptidase regulatory-like domain-containing protein [Allokutzneria albata]
MARGISRSASTVLGAGISAAVLMSFVPSAGAISGTLGAIDGTVFFDRNGNGLIDRSTSGGEAGADKAEVRLYNANGDVVADAVADANGKFRFTDLRPGTYKLDGSQSGFVSTTDAERKVEVRSSQTEFVRFGIRGGSISGLAWVDENGDGIRQDTEKAYTASRGFTLTGATDHYGKFAQRTAKVDEKGEYSFEDLPSGRYTVQTTGPDGTAATKSEAGPDATTDSDFTGKSGTVKSEKIQLAPGAGMISLDAGFTRTTN